MSLIKERCWGLQHAFPAPFLWADTTSLGGGVTFPARNKETGLGRFSEPLRVISGNAGAGMQVSLPCPGSVWSYGRVIWPCLWFSRSSPTCTCLLSLFYPFICLEAECLDEGHDQPSWGQGWGGRVMGHCTPCWNFKCWTISIKPQQHCLVLKSPASFHSSSNSKSPSSPKFGPLSEFFGSGSDSIIHPVTELKSWGISGDSSCSFRPLF